MFRKLKNTIMDKNQNQEPLPIEEGTDQMPQTSEATAPEQMPTPPPAEQLSEREEGKKRPTLKELNARFNCVHVQNVENGVELYLLSHTKVAHPSIVSTIKQKIEAKEDVGANFILYGENIQAILESDELAAI